MPNERLEVDPSWHAWVAVIDTMNCGIIVRDTEGLLAIANERALTDRGWPGDGLRTEGMGGLGRAGRPTSFPSRR